MPRVISIGRKTIILAGQVEKPLVSCPFIGPDWPNESSKCRLKLKVPSLPRYFALLPSPHARAPRTSFLKESNPTLAIE